MCSLNIEEEFLTFIPVPTTAGGNEFENKYGLDFCRNTSISCFGPVVYPPEAPPSALPKVELIMSIRPRIPWNSSVPLLTNFFYLPSTYISFSF